ncbi:large ribosomal subunit protein mL38-like [Montipora foliosa]|uniref:large ribosomal subunit protein mL38-like n=1 Tax=Montipora foliosa TaxID=591990 RepID=UPI0035F15731
MAANIAKNVCVLSCLKRVISLSLDRRSLILRSSRFCTEALKTETINQPTKRREYRKMKAKIYRENKQDSSLERAARNNMLLVPLETIRKEWMAKSEFSTLAKLARHYEIFEHVFQKKEFTPTVGLSVTFEEKHQVHYGNFLTPSQATDEPKVSYQCPEDNSHWTLVLANPDGNFLEKGKEVLHWMIGNIPGSRISEGQVLCEYLSPAPMQGTGFHRFVFCLIKQNGELDFSHNVIANRRDITSRTFSLAEFLSKHCDDLTPAGLCFFQASWDKSVTQTYLETLGITEPAYKEKEFVTPTKARKILIKNWFESKYRNM